MDETKALVFYCIDCGGMFFAAVNKPDVLKKCGDDIKDYIKEGHKMDLVSHETVGKEFGKCECEGQYR